MRKERTLFILGIWVMVLPFLGFPVAVRQAFFVLTGAGIAFIAYLLYLAKKSERPRTQKIGSELPHSTTQEMIKKPHPRIRKRQISDVKATAGSDAPTVMPVHTEISDASTPYEA